MKVIYTLVPVIILMMSCSASSPQNGQLTGNLIPFAKDLGHPVCISNCGDSRLFITDQSGYVRIVDSSGTVGSQPFLDIHQRVVYGGEQGLLGLAFHPNYASNGYFYVNYVGNGDSTHISRFSRMAGDQGKADPGSEVKLMTIFQPYQNHNGGDLKFGPDGYLYIGLGDGGSGGDPGNRAQNPNVYLGKLLRIDVNQGNPYSIPPSNPFYNNPDTLGEIWALGLRNPWRFSFDRQTGDLWIADVGQNTYEEIDFQPHSSNGGENYGWRCYEGNTVYNNEGCISSSALTFPVFTYAHGDECSVTGGYVYRGDESSPFYGYYFFADYCSDRIWTLHHTDQGWVSQEFGRFTDNNFSTFGENNKGQLFVAGLNSGTIFLVDATTTGVSENKINTAIRIFQPANAGKIRVEMGNKPANEITIKLYDVNGNTCYAGKANDATFEINTEKLATGLYFLKIVDGINSMANKVFIQK